VCFVGHWIRLTSHFFTSSAEDGFGTGCCYVAAANYNRPAPAPAMHRPKISAPCAFHHGHGSPTLPEIRAISRQPTARRHLFPHWSRRGESGGRTRPTPPRPACLRRIGQLAMSRRPPNFPPTTTSRIPAFPRPARTSLATSASVFTVPLRKELDRGRGGRIRRGERGPRKAGKGTGEQTDPGPPGQRLTWLALPPRRALPSETRSGIAQNPQLAREGKAWLRIVSRFRARQRPRRSGA
jgi:hypothetical protein